MNNASQAPWWFAAVIAVITVTGTLVSVWLTNKYANKRSQAELRHQREQFEKQWETQRQQFENQMSVQREIERRKLVYETREKMYLELSESYTSSILAFSAASSSLKESDFEEAVKLVPLLLKEVDKLIRISSACGIVASTDAEVHVLNMTTYLHGFNREFHAALQRKDHLFEGEELWMLVRKEYDKIVAVMRRDLGVVE